MTIQEVTQAQSALTVREEKYNDNANAAFPSYMNNDGRLVSPGEQISSSTSPAAQHLTHEANSIATLKLELHDAEQEALCYPDAD